MELYNQIVELLKSLPAIQGKSERQALIFSAGLDRDLVDQIELDGSTAQFCQLLVDKLGGYGTLQDGRHALVAILEAAQRQVGQEKNASCETLIQQVKTQAAAAASRAAPPDAEDAQASSNGNSAPAARPPSTHETVAIWTDQSAGVRSRRRYFMDLSCQSQRADRAGN